MTPAARSSDLAITRDSILEHARKIPAAPQVLAGLCELLQDVNTDLDQIAAEIRVDPALAARVIRIGNSPVFGSGQRLSSVDEAVNRVGFSEVLRLVGTATVAGMVDRTLNAYGIPAERLRESLLLHALASEALGGLADVDPHTAYTSGLLRAVGMMVLDRVGRARVTPAEVYDARQFPNYVAWETARFGVSSIEATTMILDDWRFPAETVAALQEHLLLGQAGLEDRLACVLNLAGAVVAESGLALAGDVACWALTPEKLAGAGLDEEQFRAAAAHAKTAFDRQRAALY